MKNKKDNYILIVAGGLGTRLWPLSNAKYPKQFIPLVSGRSLFQKMIKNAGTVTSLKNVFVVCSPEFSLFVKKQAPEIPKSNIIIEPERKDNFAAIVLAMSAIYAKNKKAKVAMLWSDHYILNNKPFTDTLKYSFLVANENPNNLVVVGTKPEYAETGFGYIKKGQRVFKKDKSVRGTFMVSAFKEKPDQRTANQYFSDNRYLWNTGYKIVSADLFLTQVKEFYPKLNKTLVGLYKFFSQKGSYVTLKKHFNNLPTGSIEVLYTHKLKKVLVVDSMLKWSDVGNWQSLKFLLDGEGRGSLGKKSSSILIDSDNVSVYGNNKLVAAVGLKDVIVVETKNGFLIVHKDSVHKVKDLYSKIKKDYPALA